ncbi:hypothetical protein GCM10010466_68420 [Planomonospora alba]|uniref:Uncharacterized protein n=1 Tax=Planomonospora alba TaxID=161354 RepID=A0ABP6P6Z4_9ACTN
MNISVPSQVDDRRKGTVTAGHIWDRQGYGSAAVYGVNTSWVRQSRTHGLRARVFTP